MDDKTRLKIEMDCLSRLEEDLEKSKERYEIQRKRVERLAEQANLFVIEAPSIVSYISPKIVEYRYGNNRSSTNK